MTKLGPAALADLAAVPADSPAEAGPVRPVAMTADDVYRAHAAAVSRWVARLSGRDVEVEDIVQEVFLVVHKRLPTFRGESSLTTWLYAIVVRVVSDRRQARRWRRWFGLRRARDGATAAELENVHAAGRSPLELLEGAEAQRIVYRILDGLSEAHRTILILFEMQGLSGQEIAAITGTTPENVWLRLHRARKQFSRRFAEWEQAQEKGDGHDDP